MVVVLTPGGLQSRGTAAQISGAIFKAPSPKTQRRVRVRVRRGRAPSIPAPTPTAPVIEEPVAPTPPSIPARTISAQISEQADPGTIRAFRPEEFQFESGLRRPFPEAAGTFFRRAVPEFVTGVGPAVGEVLKGRRGAVSEIDPLKAFEFTGRRAGEAVVQIPQFGTVTPQAPTGFKEETIFEQVRQARGRAGVPLELTGAPTSVIIRERAADIGANITETFQRKIDVGQLTVPEAQRQAGAEFAKRLERETKDVAALDTSRLFRTRGQRVAQAVETFAPTVSLAALSISGPPGAVAAGAIGLSAAQQLSVEAGRQLRSGDILGAGVSLGEAALFGIPGERVVSATLEPGARSVFGRAITRGRLAELERTSFTLGGDIFEGARGAVGRFTLSRATPLAAQEVEVLSPAFRQAVTRGGTQQFSIVGGRFVSTTRVQPFNLPRGQDVIRLTERGVFTGRGGVGGVGRLGLDFRGTQLLTALDEGIQPAIGTIDIPRETDVLRTTFGGLSARQDGTVELISGPLRAARVPRLGSRETLQTFITSPRLTGSARISRPDILDFVPISGAPTAPGGLGDTVRFQRGVGGITPTGGRLPQVSAQDLGISFTGGTVPTGAVDLGGVSLAAGQRVAETARLTLPGAAGFTPFAPTLGAAPLTTRRGQLQAQTGTLEFEGLGGQEFAATSGTGVRFDVLPIVGTGGRGRIALDTRLDQRAVQLSITLPDTRVVSRVVQETRLATRLAQRQVLESEFTQVSPFAPRARGGLGTGFGVGITPFTFPGLLGFSLGEFGRAPRRGRAPRVSVAPSFTGLALFDIGDITGGPLPTGVLPRPRLVPGRKKKKKPSKKKKKR